VDLTSILCLGMQRPGKRMLGGTGSKNCSSCQGEGSAQLTALVLAGCLSVKGRLHSFSLDDDVYRRFFSRIRNKRRTESQWRKDEHLV